MAKKKTVSDLLKERTRELSKEIARHNKTKLELNNAMWQINSNKEYF
jgi:hypothetical protein